MTPPDANNKSQSTVIIDVDDGEIKNGRKPSPAGRTPMKYTCGYSPRWSCGWRKRSSAAWTASGRRVKIDTSKIVDHPSEADIRQRAKAFPRTGPGCRTCTGSWPSAKSSTRK